MDYGAKGDGATDDRAAIVSALTAAAPSCGTVYFPASHTFLVNSNPDSGLYNNAIFKRPPCVSLDGFGTIEIGNKLSFNCLFYTARETGAVIENVTINANGQNNPVTAPYKTNYNSGRIIDVEGGQNMTIQNVTIENFNGQQGISVDVVNNQRILNNHFISLGVGGSSRNDTSTFYLDGDTKVISGNVCDGAGEAVNTCIEFHGSHNTVTGNQAKNVGSCFAYEPNISAGTPGIDNVVLSNTCFAANEGIWLYTILGPISGMQITGNKFVIDRNLAAKSNGPGFLPVGNEACIAWTPAPVYGILNLNISDNNCSFAHETATYPATQGLGGIIIEDNQPFSGTVQTIQNLTIADNSISNSPAVGIGLIGSQATVSSTTIRDNTILNPGQERGETNPFRFGIYLQHNIFGPSVSVEDNQLIDNQATPTMAYAIAWLGQAGDNAPLYARSVNNTVKYASYPAKPPWRYDQSAPYVDEEIRGFEANRAAVFTGTYASGQYPPLGSQILDPSTGNTWCNAASNGSNWGRQPCAAAEQSQHPDD